jgi:2-dehydro-3-deoxygluconokinase
MRPLRHDAQFDLVALGEPLLEFNQTRAEEEHYLQGFGGDTSNCAIAASRLGASTAYITRLGDDAFGRKFLGLWKRENVDISGVQTDPDAPTGIYFVTHGDRGHEFSYLRAGSAASRMRPADLPLDVIRDAKVLHVSGISQAISASACDSVFAALDAARESGARISYDSNLRLKLWPLARARAVIVATLPLSDWFLPSLDEAALLSGASEASAILDWCHASGAPLVALKMGSEGVWVSSAKVREHIPAHRVDAIDATGAGDCFDGAFAARIVAGDDALAAARYANAAAALATMGYGAVDPLPTPAAVAAFLKASPR